MTVWQVRSWLLQSPKPARVRLTDSEGEVKELEVSKRPLIRAAESIVAMDPELIEALGPNGDLLRALRTRVDAEPSTSPVIPNGLVGDPTALILTHLANLIHRSYEHSTEIAFGKLLELVERLDARSEAIERRLERAEVAYRREQSERIDDLWERAEEIAQSGGGKEKILETLLGSVMAGAQHRAQGGTPPPAKPNGGTS